MHLNLFLFFSLLLSSSLSSSLSLCHCSSQEQQLVRDKVQELHNQIKVIQTTLQDEKQTNATMGIKVGQFHATIETLNNDLNKLKDRLSQVRGGDWWLLLLCYCLLVTSRFDQPINQSTHENAGCYFNVTSCL